ncbi:hypothetical protein [Nocardioides hwasunensis]|uniref:Flp pilus-assembly TadG-like N-terminal domain-containing protein n=1 Tax=Nocardioides hwasunensis TaxID=397258 RepID=A0ABR8MKH2_9ACTN|nr:hypothetical protein [Nocardioides hwasunensis]MBD3916523.1 hypothetical protein [Nocardioides hwasunensis]
MRTLLKVLAGLLALVVVGYLGVNLVAVIGAHQQRGDIAERVSAELESAVPAALDRHQELVDAAGRDADVAWVEQVCDFATDDGGWIVQNYREVCTLRSVSAWQVGSDVEARGLLTVSGDQQAAYDGCERLGTIGEAEVSHVDVDASSDGEPSCLRLLRPVGETHPVAGEPTESWSGRWVVVRDEQPLVDEDIGCAHWSVLFCDNPFGDEHAFGDVPG